MRQLLMGVVLFGLGLGTGLIVHVSKYDTALKSAKEEIRLLRQINALQKAELGEIKVVVGNDRQENSVIVGN